MPIRMRNLSLFPALLLAMLWSGGGIANDTITYQALLRQALQNHPGLHGAQSAVVAAEKRIAPAGSLPDPMLSFGLAPETLGSSTIDSRYSYGIAQRLPWPGKLASRSAAQRHLRDAQTAELQGRQLQLKDMLRQRYAQWAYVHSALRINQRQQQLLQELHELSLKAYAAGQHAQQTALEAELRLQTLQRDALQLQQQSSRWTALLNAAAGRAPQQPLSLQSEPPPLPPLPPLPLLEQASLNSHPALIGLQAQAAASEQRIAGAKLAFYPDLELKANYLGAMDPEEKRWQLGLGITLPLQQQRREDLLDAARAEKQRLHWQQEDLRLNLLAELHAAWAGAHQAEQTLAHYRKQLLPLSATHLEAARAAWRSGGGAIQTVIGAEEKQMQLELGLAAALRDLWQHRSTLDRLSGGAMTSQLFPEAEQ